MEDKPRNKVATVFISHSSTDKSRFVEVLARKLRDNGVKVWYDDWALLPGDSLVDKIFEEGLKGASHFVVVLSADSLKSSWVKEELNNALVRKIEENCKLIPIVLDGVEVPSAIRHTVWQRVDDPAEFDDEFDRILRAILDIRGGDAEAASPPPYATTKPLPGLSSIDTRILETAGSLNLELDGMKVLESSEILRRLKADQVTEEAFLESLEVLEGRGYIKVHGTFGRGIESKSSFGLSTFGMQTYSEEFVEDYGLTIEAVAASLVNDSAGAAARSDREIAGAIDRPRVLVEHILDIFEMQGWVKLSKSMGGHTHVFWVSPELRRWLEDS